MFQTSYPGSSRAGSVLEAPFAFFDGTIPANTPVPASSSFFNGTIPYESPVPTNNGYLTSTRTPGIVGQQDITRSDDCVRTNFKAIPFRGFANDPLDGSILFGSTTAPGAPYMGQEIIAASVDVVNGLLSASTSAIPPSMRGTRLVNQDAWRTEVGKKYAATSPLDAASKWDVLGVKMCESLGPGYAPTAASAYAQPWDKSGTSAYTPLTANVYGVSPCLQMFSSCDLKPGDQLYGMYTRGDFSQWKSSLTSREELALIFFSSSDRHLPSFHSTPQFALQRHGSVTLEDGTEANFPLPVDMVKAYKTPKQYSPFQNTRINLLTYHSKNVPTVQSGYIGMDQRTRKLDYVQSSEKEHSEIVYEAAEIGCVFRIGVVHKPAPGVPEEKRLKAHFNKSDQYGIPPVDIFFQGGM
jgi:hypothetical protein